MALRRPHPAPHRTPIFVLTAIGLAATVALALAGLVPVPALGMAAAACLPVAAALV